MDIQQLGFNDWFEERKDADLPDDFRIVRIITSGRRHYTISNGIVEIQAESSGKLMYQGDSPLDFPAVGDWVYAQIMEADSTAIIHRIFPRRSQLVRKTAGKRIEYQLLAANIDTAFIIQAFDADYNLRRLERYLVMVNDGRIRPVVLLSKSDLKPREEVDGIISDIRRLMPEVTVLAFSTITGSGVEKIREFLLPARTFCLLGSSGVGKTTLINHLIGRDMFETRAVRETDGKGRHTTTRRQLITLPNGALMIDTPGMRELGTIALDGGLEDTFGEITELSGGCRFHDCRHTTETGCAVLAALRDGSLDPGRYRNYLKMKKEADFHNASYLEKKERDKKFGKMVKSVMKHKKNRR
jgi:ribosome biogenesis GTPase